MSSCVKPLKQNSRKSPLVLLHGFDSSCLEWRYAFPLLGEAGLEAWAVDILRWGFSDLVIRLTIIWIHIMLSLLWKSHIKRPITLVGPSLGAAIAIDFAVNHPESVDKLVFIDANVYAEGTGELAKLPQVMAYAGVMLLKSVLLRLFVNFLAFNHLPLSSSIDRMNVGCLHCLYHWWEDATVNFMTSGGYNVLALIEKVKQRTLIIWGEDDQIVSNKLPVRLHSELPNAIIHQIPNCGHIPRVESPHAVAKLIL